VNKHKPADTGKRTLAFIINMLPVSLVIGFMDAYTLDHEFYSALSILTLIVFAALFKWSPGGAIMKLNVLSDEGKDVRVFKRVLRMAPFILILLFMIIGDGLRTMNYNLQDETKLVLHYSMKILIGLTLVNFGYVLHDPDERTFIDRFLGIGVYSKVDRLAENFKNGEIRTSRWW
jgi:uncharacterized RDD family membrane protein YckC